jgi:hypothetical protein
MSQENVEIVTQTPLPVARKSAKLARILARTYSMARDLAQASRGRRRGTKLYN